jgi:two-component system sensor histidine kinase BaeS
MISPLVALTLAAGLGFLLARHLSRPVRQLAEAVGALTRGNYAARAPVSTQDEIGALGRDVNRLAETLEGNQSARRKWIADIAHELRTPVSVLKGEIEALEDGVRPLDSGATRSLREETEQLSRLVGDLQTLALSDAGALNLQVEPVDLSKLLNQTLDTFRSRLSARKLVLDSQLPEELWLEGDARRLRQLLQNLLENTCRYVEAGGQVLLKLRRVDGEAQLSIDDSGPGLAEHERSRLFERFYRVEGSRSRVSGGSGLGLSICRNIAEAHQGSLRALESQLGGLRIELLLPAG